MNGPIDLGPVQLGLAALLILLNAAISLRLQLGLGRRLLLASLRSVVQLSLLGLLLAWVFSVQGPWAVLPLMVLMALIAGVEAVRRTTRRVPGIFGASIGVVLATSMAITFYGLVLVIGVEPWYAPRYAVPILGMVLGNTLTGISLGLETTMRGFDRDRAQVELLLAHGATRKEASREVVRGAVRTGMIPILNSMVAAGLISIPGMMTLPDRAQAGSEVRLTSEQLIGAMVEQFPATKEVLRRRFGEGCFTCPGFATETLAQGAMMHGVDMQELLAELEQTIRRGS